MMSYHTKFNRIFEVGSDTNRSRWCIIHLWIIPTLCRFWNKISHQTYNIIIKKYDDLLLRKAKRYILTLQFAILPMYFETVVCCLPILSYVFEMTSNTNSFVYAEPHLLMEIERLTNNYNCFDNHLTPN